MMLETSHLLSSLMKRQIGKLRNSMMVIFNIGQGLSMKSSMHIVVHYLLVIAIVTNLYCILMNLWTTCHWIVNFYYILEWTGQM